jgi:hypothetical protein
MSHINIPAPRLRRLLRLLDLRAAGKRRAEIRRAEGITDRTLASDYLILAAHSRAELEAKLTRWSPPPKPKRSRSACVYTVVRAGLVHGCGRECEGQYCDEHRRATRPGPGQYVAMSAQVYLRASGGKCR